MANTYRNHLANANGAHQDAEKKTYLRPICNAYAGASVNADTRYVHPNHLANNGVAVQPHQPTDTRPMQSVQVVIPSPHRTISTMSVKPMFRNPNQPSVPAPPPSDYQLLLFSLAEDYFAAAHSAGSIRALLRRQSGILEYQKLLATGLSCLEASLKV